ncbi:MAG TPA: sterol desaturase family protein [Methylomirabilota bacterium]|nr:sterol desaturase family protein [Methylomirabilota bacterium]
MESYLTNFFQVNGLPGAASLTTKITVALAVRYLITAGIAWLLAYVWFKRRWLHRKIIAGMPSSADVRREMLYSASSLFIFGAMGAATIIASKQGWTQMYWRVGERGWAWFWASIAIVIFLHDAYFYWTHRLMHHPKLFRHFHRVHHVSTNPSPWAAYSFAPLEAVVQAGIFPLAVLLVPMHPLAFALFMGWQILFNVAGHTGYEFHPRWLMDTPLRYFLNTPTNHIMHHETMRGNYCLYFNIWDRLMGTNHARYEARFREVTAQKVARTDLGRNDIARKMV